MRVLQNRLQPGGRRGVDWDEPTRVDNNWLNGFLLSCLGLPTRGWLSPTEVISRKGVSELLSPKSTVQNTESGWRKSRTCNVFRWWSKVKSSLWRPPAEQDLRLPGPWGWFWPGLFVLICWQFCDHFPPYRQVKFMMKQYKTKTRSDE